MKKVSIDDVEPGDVTATDIKIHSNQPNVQFRLRIDKDRALTQKQIDRLSREGVPYIFVRDNRLDDLDKFIHDGNIQEAEDELGEELINIRQNIESGSNFTISVERLQKSLENLIQALKNSHAMQAIPTVKAHCDYTAKHSIDVAKLSIHLLLTHKSRLRDKLRAESGASVNYTNRHFMEDLGLGTLLYDIGKWDIPAEILKKTSELDDEEWETVKNHPTRGRDLLKSQDRDFRASILVPAFQHHEQFSGSGYPRGLEGKNIHLYGRITAICDVYSALTSARPYRLHKSPNRARQVMNKMQEEDKHFDPDIFKMFKNAIPAFPVGQEVILDDGRCGVVSGLEDDKDKPIVRILNENNEKISEPYEIQANTESGPTIIN